MGEKREKAEGISGLIQKREEEIEKMFEGDEEGLREYLKHPIVPKDTDAKTPKEKILRGKLEGLREIMNDYHNCVFGKTKEGEGTRYTREHALGQVEVIEIVLMWIDEQERAIAEKGMYAGMTEEEIAEMRVWVHVGDGRKISGMLLDDKAGLCDVKISIGSLALSKREDE